ncbi:MAG: hypothetical protein FJW40_10705 [Acidobacteria bacterium]|nr:hypothetical protein [Acidobacteriota bacterium]
MRGRTGALTLAVILTNVLGNFSLSWGMKYGGAMPLIDPWVVGGAALLTLWMLARMALIGTADLSYVLPVTSIGYALTAILGRVFHQEQITSARWWGILLIVAGTAIVSFTPPKTESAR